MTESAQAETARRALEDVCSGRDLSSLESVYHPEFIDHVNAAVYRGHAGARQSVGLYLALFPDLGFVVEDQVTEGDRVASRWTLHGTHLGRRVHLTGIVISRFQDDRIVEDHAASDTMELVRQLGFWRSALLVVRYWRLVFNPPRLRLR
jgi:predicted ester cyclase